MCKMPSRRPKTPYGLELIRKWLELCDHGFVWGGPRAFDSCSYRMTSGSENQELYCRHGVSERPHVKGLKHARDRMA